MLDALADLLMQSEDGSSTSQSPQDHHHVQQLLMQHAQRKAAESLALSPPHSHTATTARSGYAADGISEPSFLSVTDIAGQYDQSVPPFTFQGHSGRSQQTEVQTHSREYDLYARMLQEHQQTLRPAGTPRLHQPLELNPPQLSSHQHPHALQQYQQGSIKQTHPPEPSLRLPTELQQQLQQQQQYAALAAPVGPDVSFQHLYQPPSPVSISQPNHVNNSSSGSAAALLSPWPITFTQLAISPVARTTTLAYSSAGSAVTAGPHRGMTVGLPGYPYTATAGVAATAETVMAALVDDFANNQQVQQLSSTHWASRAVRPEGGLPRKLNS